MSEPRLLAKLQAAFDREVSRNSRLSLLLFDLDGTLVDTMGLHYEAYAEVFQSLGAELERTAFDRSVGPPARVTIRLFAQAAGLGEISDEDALSIHHQKKIALEAILVDKVPSLLPASKILEHAADKFKIAVVTSGNRRGASAILRASGLSSHVHELVASDDVTKGKPDPEPFQTALARFGVQACQALAFEDHANGIQSATGCRLTVIDVRDGTTFRSR